MKEKIFTWKGTVVLKLLLLHLMLFTCMSARTAHAQDDPMLYKEVQLQKKSYTFDELTHAIQQQTGITFSYNASKISANRHFRIKTKRMTAVKLLALIKAKSGIGYKVIHPGFIVYQPPKNVSARPKKLRPKKKEKPAVLAKSTPTKSARTATHTTTTSEALPRTPVPTDSTTQTVVVIGDSATASDYYFGGAGSGGGGNMGNIEMVMRYPGNNDNVINPYASLNPPGNEYQQPSGTWNQADIGSFFRKNLLLSAGLSVGETYYFSPALHFGFRFLYADLSYNVGAYSQFRYGLGAEAQINERWALQVDFNTGKSFSEPYVYTTFDTFFPPPPDSPPPPIITEVNTSIFVQSQLTRFSFSVVRKVNKNLSLSGGLVFNRLSTQYFSGGQPFDLNNLEPPVIDAENRFRTLKPPYELSRNYSPADARLTQLWVGFRIAVFYRLNFSEP